MTLIDNIIVSQNLCGSFQSSILIDDISDHMPTDCVIKSLKSAKKDPITIQTRDTQPKNLKALITHLDSYDWPMTLKTDSSNIGMQRFHDILQTELDICIPEHTRKIKVNKI